MKNKWSDIMVDDFTSKIMYNMWHSGKNRSLLHLQHKIFITGLHPPGGKGEFTLPGEGLGGIFLKILY